MVYFIAFFSTGPGVTYPNVLVLQSQCWEVLLYFYLQFIEIIEVLHTPHSLQPLKKANKQTKKIHYMQGSSEI